MLDIIVPFYRRPDLVSRLFASFHRAGPELAELACSLIVVNDSPDDPELKQELAREGRRLGGIFQEHIVLENQANEGFVRSANRAFEQTIARQRDAVLLNSDTVLFPGAIAEMRRVAYLDPAIGFVSPRSNHATLCSFPHQPEYRSLTPDESFSIYHSLASYLPEYHYAPTGVGFCLYVKLQVFEAAGVFDKIYSPGCHEENDLIQRARALGYRVALANRAYVYHAGSASFSVRPMREADLENANRTTLNRRYPNYAAQVDEYYRSAHVQAEILLTGLLNRAGRRRLLVDRNHTSQNIEPALEYWSQWFDISFLEHTHVETSRPFAVAVCLGLPSDSGQVFRLSRAAVANVYATVGPAQSHSDLSDFALANADGVIYSNGIFRDCPAAREFTGDLSLAGPFLEETAKLASFETVKRRLRLAGLFEREHEEREKLKRELNRRDRAQAILQAENGRVMAEIRARQQEIAQLRQSRTWRWTAPFRKLVDGITGVMKRG